MEGGPVVATASHTIPIAQAVSTSTSSASHSSTAAVALKSPESIRFVSEFSSPSICPNLPESHNYRRSYIGGNLYFKGSVEPHMDISKEASRVQKPFVDANHFSGCIVYSVYTSMFVVKW